METCLSNFFLVIPDILTSPGRPRPFCWAPLLKTCWTTKASSWVFWMSTGQGVHSFPCGWPSTPYLVTAGVPNHCGLSCICGVWSHQPYLVCHSPALLGGNRERAGLKVLMISLEKQVDFKEETWEYEGMLPLLATKWPSFPPPSTSPCPEIWQEWSPFTQMAKL